MERRADPSTRLDVDIAILDYLLYTTVKAFIHDYRKSRLKNDDADGPDYTACTMLDIVHSFLIIFRSTHPREHCSNEIRSLLQLLKFTSLFCNRFAFVQVQPSREKIKGVRAQNCRRRKAFDSVAYSAGYVDKKLLDRIGKVQDQEASNGDAQTGLYEPANSVSLTDTLPFFMILSAAQSALQNNPVSEVWMDLASRYMAHAAVELSLSGRMSLVDAVKEAFSWGFDPECSAAQGSDEWAINYMFFGQNGEVAGWRELVDERIRAIVPPKDIPLQVHTNTLFTENLIIETFEEKLMCFIEGLLRAHPTPLYTQLETGKVDELSEIETQTLREAVGIR